MTKKHFIALAKLLNDTRKMALTSDTSSAFNVWTTMRDGIMTIAQQENPRFDRARFIAATEKE